MRIAVLSNVTTQVLCGMLRNEHSLWQPTGFGAWMETAIEPPADLVAFDPEQICILLDSHFAPLHGDVDVAKKALVGRFPKAAVCVLDVSRFAVDFGDAFYDERMWKLGKMPWSLTGLRELKKVFSIKKVLAVDLDNTLWDGVVGEDGPQGVRIRSQFLDEMRSLRQRGVLLAVLSKNDPADVSWFLEKDDLFVAKAVNWEPKADNLMRMAEELNLGVDSFVFVDDNPAERAEMRALRPEVLVADFPPQLDVFFPRRELTAEDLRKTEQYRAEGRRREFAAGLSADDYLRGLEIRTDVHVIAEPEIPRVAQLSQKTNQFNVCTHRYSETDVRRFAAADDHLLLTLHAGDRFGDLGLVAFVLAKCGDGEACILDWVMSCRAMNRRIEFAVEAELERRLKERGVRRITATYLPTPKNVPVRELFERFGFSLTKEDGGVKRYERILG